MIDSPDVNGDAPTAADLKGTQAELRTKLQAIVPALNQRIAEAGVETRRDSIDLDTSGASLRSLPDNTELSFWGSVEDTFALTRFGEPTAIIKTMLFPTSGPETKSRFVDAWEEIMASLGIQNLAATNIRNRDVFEFWQNRGYVSRGSERDGIPYAMVKISNDSTT